MKLTHPVYGMDCPLEDLEEIAKSVPASALNDYVEAKSAWADNVLEGTGASVDLLSIAASDYDAQEARLYAVRGDANGLRRVADRVMKGADSNLQLATALHEGGHRVIQGMDGRFSIETDHGIMPLSAALRGGWLYGR